MLIIPLGLEQSRGDQILNAKAFQEKGYALTLEEENLNDQRLKELLDKLYENKDVIQKSMENSHQGNALQTLVHEINHSSYVT